MKRFSRKSSNRNAEKKGLALLEDPDYWKRWEEDLKKWREERSAKRKDAILHLRINSRDLAALKEKARDAGMGYQPFIAEILKRAAHS